MASFAIASAPTAKAPMADAPIANPTNASAADLEDVKTFSQVTWLIVTGSALVYRAAARLLIAAIRYINTHLIRSTSPGVMCHSAQLRVKPHLLPRPSKRKSLKVKSLPNRRKWHSECYRHRRWYSCVTTAFGSLRCSSAYCPSREAPLVAPRL